MTPEERQRLLNAAGSAAAILKRGVTETERRVGTELELALIPIWRELAKAAPTPRPVPEDDE